MNEELSRKMQALGDAINTSLSDSDGIATAVSDIKRSGYEVFLVLEATIGITPQDGVESPDEEMKGPIEFKWTSEDDDWLKKMKIGEPENERL